MPKPKRGLHKNISSIFKGVPVHRDGGAAPQGPGPGRLPSQTWPERPKPEKQEPEPQHQESPPQIEQPKPPGKESERQQQGPVQQSQQPKPEPVSPATEQPRPEPRPPEPTAGQPEPVTRQARPSAKPKFALPAQWQHAFEQIKARVLTPKPGVDPKRQKAMVIVVPVLVIVLIIVLSKMLSKPAAATAKSNDLGPSAAANASPAEINWQVPKPYPPTLRDPTTYGPRPSAGENSGLLIRGIVYSKDDPSAVIGTRIVRAGDKVAGVKVIKINQNSVEFECDGKRWTQQVQ